MTEQRRAIHFDAKCSAMKTPFLSAVVLAILALAASACGGEQSEGEQRFKAAESLLQQGRLAEAILAYRTAISLEPEEAKFRFGRAEAYIKLDRYTLAIDDYTEVIRLDPNFDLIYLRRGTAYLVLSDTERAISDFDEAIRLAPDKAAGAYAGRARVLTLRGRHTEAQEAVERAVELGLDRRLLEEEIEDIKSKR